MTDEVKPLTPAQMKYAKKRWPRRNYFRSHKLEGGWNSINDLIADFERVVPEEHRGIARLSVERDRDDYESPWLEVYYSVEVSVEEWEANVTQLFRREQALNRENKEKLDKAERETYERLKIKFEGKT